MSVTLNVTLSELKKIMPFAAQRADVYLLPLNRAMDEFEIDTPLRRAAFLAQVAHESGHLRYVVEIASGRAYEGRLDLGNTEAGDGVRFRGRGLIQITGRSNYSACSKALYGDPNMLLTHPEILQGVVPSSRSAAWFWKAFNLNKWADQGDFDGVSDVINRGRKTPSYGDANGFDDRLAAYQRAKEVLLCSSKAIQQ